MEQPESLEVQDEADRYAEGVDAAHEWAGENAGHGDLLRVLQMAKRRGAYLTDLDILAVLGADDETDVFGEDCEDAAAPGFVRGFVDGTRQVQEIVDEILRKRT